MELKDKEFITLCRALDLKPNDGVIVTKFTDTEKQIVISLAEIKYDSETGVAYLKTNRGNVILASEIATLERNRSLKGVVSKKEVV